MLVEKSIVLFSKHKKYLFYCIACFNQLLYPLRWVLKSASILSCKSIDEINELLDFPQGFIFGLQSIIGLNLPKRVTLLNIDNNTITNPLHIQNCNMENEILIDKLNSILSSQVPHPYCRDVAYKPKFNI